MAISGLITRKPIIADTASCVISGTASPQLSWVLPSAYALSRQQLAEALEGVLRSKGWVVEKTDIVWQAVRLFRSGRADFADCLIFRSAAAAGCVEVKGRQANETSARKAQTMLDAGHAAEAPSFILCRR